MGKFREQGGPVVVTDALLRKALAAVRSLGSRGIEVYAADTTRLTPAGLSKYCRRSIRSPSPAESPDSYRDWLAALPQRLPGVMTFPMDDASIRAALPLSDQLPPGSFCLLPPPQAFETASDKYATVRLAETLGIECPRTWLPSGEKELASIWSAEGGGPVVVKPRRSSGSRGIRICAEWGQLLKAYREASAIGELPMIQQYIPPGERFDAAVLMDEEGRPVASFAQREVRHYPADIGPSTVQESVSRPELVEQAISLLGKLNWRGVAEAEWMRDPRDGRLKLMEINPRYWNSLHLAIQSGIDFPFLHYRLSRGEKVGPIHTYSVGQIARNLLPGDLLHAWSTRTLRGLDPPLLSKGGRPVEDDIWSRRDPAAAVGFALACARFALDKRMWSAVFKR